MLDILEALALANEELSLSELQSQLHLPPPTLHRMLRVLIQRGYVEPNEESRHYGPGLRIIQMAEATTRNARFDLIRVARPVLKRLTDESGESSNLVVPQNRKIVYVDQVPSPRSVRMFTEVGQRAPLYCTASGKAILSRLPADELEAYLAATVLKRVTPRTVVSPTALQHEIETIKDRGYALDDEEYETGVRCVASAVMNHLGRCVAANSVSGPTNRMTPGLHPRRLVPPLCGVVPLAVDRHDPDARRARLRVGSAPPAAGPDSSLGPRRPVRERCLRRAAAGGQRPGQHGGRR